MKNILGFLTQSEDSVISETDESKQRELSVRSLVRIFFDARNITLSYYNDKYDLHCGDIVYVDGKLEGLRGRVVGVEYNFKIRISDYKRVIGMANTAVRGRFHFAASHLITFDANALPYEMAFTWFSAPRKEDDEYETGSDGTSFMLDDLSAMKIDAQTAERGHEYFAENKVSYLCLAGTHGRAIVEGTRPYEVEFDYCGGEVRDLVCSCFCCGACKHDVAAMLQLREALGIIDERYAEDYARSGYFAEIGKAALFSLVISGKDGGGLLFD